MNSGEGEGFVLEISLKHELRLLHVEGDDMANASISQEEKAAALKEMLRISPDKRLIPTLGDQCTLYKGPLLRQGRDHDDEIIVPHSLAACARSNIVERYDINKHVPKLLLKTIDASFAGN